MEKPWKGRYFYFLWKIGHSKSHSKNIYSYIVSPICEIVQKRVLESNLTHTQEIRSTVLLSLVELRKESHITLQVYYENCEDEELLDFLLSLVNLMKKMTGKCK